MKRLYFHPSLTIGNCPHPHGIRFRRTGFLEYQYDCPPASIAGIAPRDPAGLPDPLTIRHPASMVWDHFANDARNAQVPSQTEMPLSQYDFADFVSPSTTGEQADRNMKTFELIMDTLLLFSVGAACLFFPAKIQEFTINCVDRGLAPASTRVFFRSNRYLVLVRCAGLGIVVIGSFLAWEFFRNAIR